MPNKTRFQMFIEPAQMRELRRLQEVTGAPVAESIRRAIAAYLDTQVEAAIRDVAAYRAYDGPEPEQHRKKAKQGAKVIQGMVRMRVKTRKKALK